MNKKIVEDRLTYLAEKNHGDLTPETVVTDAQKKTSPLHKHGGFQWNLSEAAKQSWLQHARMLIRTFPVIYRSADGVERKGYGFVRDVRQPANRQGYSTVQTVASDRDRAMATLKHEADAISASIVRLQTLAAQFNLEPEIQAVVVAFATLRDGIREVVVQ